MNLGQPLPVLMYHHVSPRPGLVTCSPENFRGQMRWLAENGWRTLTAAAFADGLAAGHWPERSVLLTFDDGYLDNWVHAHPVLAEFGQTAVIFLITGWLGDGPARPHAGQAGAPALPSHNEAMAAARGGDFDVAFLRWSEVEAMRAAGTAEFHSHTHHHRRFDREIADLAARRDALTEDLATSRATLAERLGETAPHLCWPQGYYDTDYQAIAVAAGFRFLHTTRHGVVRPGCDPAALPRIVVKDRGADWFGRRLALYRRPWLSALYLALKGH